MPACTISFGTEMPARRWYASTSAVASPSSNSSHSVGSGSFEWVVGCLALIEEILVALHREVESVLTQGAVQLLESLPDFGWSLARPRDIERLALVTEDEGGIAGIGRGVAEK